MTVRGPINQPHAGDPTVFGKVAVLLGGDSAERESQPQHPSNGQPLL